MQFLQDWELPVPSSWSHRTETSAGMRGDPLSGLHGCCGCRALGGEQETSRKVVPFPPAFIFLFICTHGSTPVVLMVISPSETGAIHAGGSALLVDKKDPANQADKMGR